MPWGIGTESLGMIGCIFAENGPLEGGIESNSGVPAGVLRVISDGFLASIRALSNGTPTIFRKHMPWGMGTESLGMIGCIFGENGPLEGGIEWSLNGTVRGAKGEFRRFYYLYPYIFESRAPTFFERKCHELCAHQSWERSDSYSWRNDFWKVEFEHVCKKPTGVLMVFWSGFLAHTRAFSKRGPTIFRKHMPWGMGTESLGMIGCVFAENGPLEGGIESSFSGTGWGAKGDFRWIFAPTRAFSKEPSPPNFPKAHALSYRHRKFGDDGCIFAENGPLEGGIESSFSGTGWGAKGDFRWIFDPNPCIFEGGPPPFSESTCPQIWAQKVWGRSDIYLRRMGP